MNTMCARRAAWRAPRHPRPLDIARTSVPCPVAPNATHLIDGRITVGSDHHRQRARQRRQPPRRTLAMFENQPAATGRQPAPAVQRHLPPTAAATTDQRAGRPTSPATFALRQPAPADSRACPPRTAVQFAAAPIHFVAAQETGCAPLDAHRDGSSPRAGGGDCGRHRRLGSEQDRQRLGPVSGERGATTGVDRRAACGSARRDGPTTQGPGIVAFAHVSASARARARSAAWCRRPAAMLSHPAMRSRLMATLRQVAMTRGACPVRTWDWSSA